MKRTGLAIIALVATLCAFGQYKTENLVIVTMDGMRWQEVFGGADSVLLTSKSFTKDSSGTSGTFWSKSASDRRKKLMPFLWNTIAVSGQVYGNRWLGNKVNVSNRYNFSYPGYNEIFTGYPDTLVNSNDKIPNKNTNVLGFINQQNGYKNKVAVFTTWDVFPYILNAKKTGLYVNADVDTLKFKIPSLQLINDMQFLTTRPIGVRPDIFTYFAAREYLKAYQPKVLYIAFDETDDFAHGGEYDQYLKSAYSQDAMISDLWKYIQSSPRYKNNTTLLITCDHGRGDKDKENWQRHGASIEEASETWIAVIGPDTPPSGEMKTTAQLYQKQLAATFANLLQLSFTANHPIAPPIEHIYKK